MAAARFATAFLLAIAAGSLLICWMTVQPFTRIVPSAPPAVAAARLEQHVRRLSSDLYPRSFDQPRRLEAAASYIRSELESAGAQAADQVVTVQESRYRNIVARFGPARGELLVIGAHYDSHGDAAGGAKLPGGFGTETHTPGADDNASGVAALLELARLLNKFPPPRPVELVAFTLEEPPHFRTEHMGSAWHARSLRQAQRPVALMLSLEMIGFFGDADGSQSYPLPGMTLLYPGRGNFIAVIGRYADWSETRSVKAIMAGATDLPVRSMNAFALIPGVDFSDHLNYWAEGFPALMITDTAFYRNSHYHRAGDTYDKLDYGRMAKVVQAVFAVTQSF